MDNEQCQTRVQEKKKLKTWKEAKHGRGRESKPTLKGFKKLVMT